MAANLIREIQEDFSAGMVRETAPRGNADNWVVDPETACFLWQGATCAGGYGMVRVGGRKGKSVLAHRHYYERANGSIPEGHELHHSCHVPSCVNPAHLSLLDTKTHARLHAPKLTAEKAEDIRGRYAEGERSADLAEEYGISQSTVQRVVNGELWS